MSSCRATLALALAIVLAGCGFRPMYGNAGGNSDVFAELATISVAPIPDRPGQQLRTNLTQLLTPQGKPTDSRYRLSVKLTESRQLIAVARTGLSTRAQLTLTASYTLTDLATRTDVLRDTASIISAYNILDSDYSTLTSENFARTRGLEQLAQDIRSRLGAHFSARAAAAAPG